MIGQMIQDGAAVGEFPAGTVVHLGGIPFRLLAAARVEGTMGNFILAEEAIGSQAERHYSSADVSGA